MLGTTRRRIKILTVQSAVEVMATLNKLGGKVPLAMLCKALAMDNGSISPVITKLELAGLINTSKVGRTLNVCIDHQGCIAAISGLGDILIPKGSHVTLPIDGESDLAAAKLLLGTSTRGPSVARRNKHSRGGEAVVADQPAVGREPVRKQAPWRAEDTDSELLELDNLEGW